MKTIIVLEFLQFDGWHSAGIASSPKRARRWTAAVDESAGHHHARRWRRVEISSWAAEAAYQYEEEKLRAVQWVSEHDDNDKLDQDELEAAFTALYERRPEETQ